MLNYVSMTQVIVFNYHLLHFALYCLIHMPELEYIFFLKEPAFFGFINLKFKTGSYQNVIPHHFCSLYY